MAEFVCLNKSPMENEELDTLESLSQEEVVEVEEFNEEEGTEELTKAKELADNYKKRAEKAEKKLKETPVVESKKEASTLTREEAILFAKGLDEEDVEDAQFISDRKGISIMEATDTREFKTLKKERDIEAKNNQAQQRASRGSKVQSKKSVSDSGLSKEEHKELWKEKMGS